LFEGGALGFAAERTLGEKVHGDKHAQQERQERQSEFPE
jgi:hypothetical protein